MKEVTSFKFELNKYIMPLGNSSVPNEDMSLHCKVIPVYLNGNQFSPTICHSYIQEYALT